MIYLAAGYAVIWIVAFGFIYSMVSRQQSIQKDVAMLEQFLKEDELL